MKSQDGVGVDVTYVVYVSKVIDTRVGHNACKLIPHILQLITNNNINKQQCSPSSHFPLSHFLQI